MATTQLDKSFAEAFEELSDGQQLITMALGVVVKRMTALAESDRRDLLELFQALPTAKGREEIQSIRRAMLEILTDPPIQSRRMSQAVDEPMPPGLKKWTEHVGGRIRELREKAGMSQTKLAEKAGLTQSHVSRLEKAEHSATHKTLMKIASALGVEVGRLDPCLE